MVTQGSQVPAPARFQLSSTRLPAVNRGLSVGMSVIFVPVMVVGLLGGAALAGSGDATFTVLGIFLLVLAIVGLVVVAGSLVFVFRYGAWLEGTVLVRRNALTTRRVDLSTAQSFRVRVPVPGGWYVTVPALYAGGDASGASVTVSFRRATKGFLPAPEAQALAWAIGTGRRSGFAAEQAAEAIRALQHLAVGAPSVAPRA